MKPTIVILVTAALAACSTTAGNRCPPLVSYSPERLAVVKKELAGLPTNSVVKDLVKDYHRTRDACRAAGE